LAFVFGPFDYLYLGLWRKAITLSPIALVIDAIFGMAGDALNFSVHHFLWMVSAVTFRQCAHVDYYRKTVLKSQSVCGAPRQSIVPTKVASAQRAQWRSGAMPQSPPPDKSTLVPFSHAVTRSPENPHPHTKPRRDALAFCVDRGETHRLHFYY
jgi:hypothetical protein